MTDVGHSQLLANLRCVDGESIKENYFCSPLPEKITDEEVWVYCEMGTKLCRCVHGWATAILGRTKGLISQVAKENLAVLKTHCFSHQEAFMAKTLPKALPDGLYDGLHTVNFIIERPLKSYLFAFL